MREKLVSVEQAAQIVKDGDHIVFNGSMDWTPMAMLRELARREIKSTMSILMYRPDGLMGPP